MTETDILKPSKLFTPKNVARFVVGNATRFVVTATIASLVPAETKLERVKLAVGSYVIASIVADKAKDYIGQEIDDVTELWNSVKGQFSSETDIPTP
jgi:hypothetical protein